MWLTRRKEEFLPWLLALPHSPSFVTSIAANCYQAQGRKALLVLKTGRPGKLLGSHSYNCTLSSKGTEKFFRPINDPEEWKLIRAQPDRYGRFNYPVAAIQE
jgi:hypothetical protein